MEKYFEKVSKNPLRGKIYYFIFHFVSLQTILIENWNIFENKTFGEWQGTKLKVKFLNFISK